MNANKYQKRIGALSLWTLAAMATVAMIGSLHAAKKMSGDDISNMIIEGESRLKVNPQVPAFDWKVDTTKNVAELLRDNSIMGDLKPPALKTPPLNFPNKLATDKAASPWLTQIFESPILTLETKGEDNGKKQDWIFLVKDSRGKTFYQDSGHRSLPQTIEWNGFGDTGDALKVGFDYNYSLSILDEAGNPQRYSGKPFRIPAFRYSASGKSVTAIEPDALFESASTAKISQEGVEYLTEAKDFIRRNSGKKIEVTAFEDDEKFGLARSQAVKRFLVKALDLQDESISASVLPQAKGGGYRHVDIVVK